MWQSMQALCASGATAAFACPAWHWTQVVASPLNPPSPYFVLLCGAWHVVHASSRCGDALPSVD